MMVALLGISVPSFFLGLLFIIWFAVGLGWVPTGGYVAFTDDPWGWFRTSTMPAVSLALLNVGLLARVTRSTMLEVLRQDYVRTARAKGLPRHLVVGKHALANAMIPITTVVGIIISLLVSGSVVTETLVQHTGDRAVAYVGGAGTGLSDGAGGVVAGDGDAGVDQSGGGYAVCGFGPSDTVWAMILGLQADRRQRQCTRKGRVNDGDRRGFDERVCRPWRAQSGGDAVKAQLASKIGEIIRRRRLTQLEAAQLIGMPQPKLSGLLRGQFRGISEAKMLSCLTRLGRDVHIVVGPARRRAGVKHIEVRSG